MMKFRRIFRVIKVHLLRMAGKKVSEDLLVSCSEYFCNDWYQNEYPDVDHSEVCPAHHYAKHGYLEGRRPGPLFSQDWYMAKNRSKSDEKLPLLDFQRDIAAKKEVKRLLSGEAAECKAGPRIVYESHSLDLQGAPQSLTEIMLGVASTGEYDAVLSCATFGPIAERAYASGIPVRVHGITQQQVRKEHLWDKNISKLSLLYQNLGADLVHVNTITAFHCVLAAANANIPVVWNIRESIAPVEYGEQLCGFLADKLHSAIRVADFLVFVSKASERLWQSSKPRLKKTIYNSLDLPYVGSNMDLSEKRGLRQQLGVDESSFVLLSVGTICERKGQADLLKMAEYLLTNDLLTANLEIICVGANSSDYSVAFSEAANSLNKRTDKVRITLIDQSCDVMRNEELYRWYQLADSFVLNSRSESYPRVILEAIGCGLPVVATPTFGVLEQISNIGRSLLYTPGDIEKLAQCVYQLMVDSGLRGLLSRDSRARFQEINDYRSMLKEYSDCYARLLHV